VNPNHREINAQAAHADPESVLHHYRRLIELRHSEPAVVHGDFTMLLEDDERIYAFLRRFEAVELLVVGNVSGEAAVADVPDAAAWAAAELVLANVPVAQGADLSLGPWEARVYRRR
jgi:oligo-1,6-glucosidase